MALYNTASMSGLGLWASSGANPIDQGSGVGVQAQLFIKDGGDVGIGNIAPTYKLDVTSTTRATGDLICQDIIGSCSNNTQYATATARLNIVAGSGRNAAAHFISEQAGSQTCTSWNQATRSNVYLHEYVNGPNRTVVRSITTNGTSASYNTSSDARLKDVTGDATNGLQTVLALRAGAWGWKATQQDDEGPIAQEVLDVFPSAVSGTEDGQYMLDHSKIVPVLIRACQQQHILIAALTARIAALGAKKTMEHKCTRNIHTEIGSRKE